MKSLIEVIAKALVDHPDAVSIEEVLQERNTVYRLSVHPDDMGKVIGKQGRIAKSLRTVVGAMATKENQRVTIEIV
ncbi:KH domain-containing protein [Aneurinibacillus aneurinilyticus]|uniref:RNA-binding protein KhpA n=2 Tax=Aneurinibacillus aneurinilyticus TaxID=1391 RepID=A0A848CUI2_ANEAE|nr:KH domain-containing protein [Aneurinibacillus aneurinilyticus]ERI09181.1 KH domain protein [Aneurinibacillus aneurinilyticus ATCC 12856]MCI1692366.1 KH domain-containing protein [Aneurinibacillus aneurinilyticus]MED0669291.1 KH domain-containing protein [Aneurinibacillus aneurinilyticus]MED0707462.1 KH domain-containing protein [Aneurinibacillus aneurinilyticus]MED0724730.1 KH domain-containing protein [Aneurinibacillus aneurinilyticus]